MSDQLSFFKNKLLTDSLFRAVEKYIAANMVGFKEYDLLTYLDEQGYFQDLPASDSSSLIMFQKHFLLFHVLYSINKKLSDSREGALQISTLLIKKLEAVDAGSQVGEVDKLSGYYLDLENLVSANESNVNELLNSFWEKYLRNDRRGDALKVLGLNDPVSDKDIIQRYRKLASVHHPDKGGDKDKIQEINEAYAVLIKI